MKVCGVIAEYDPFHKGHERHIRLAREKTGAEHVICVMSGSFTQRGMPALLPAHARAEMALACGADVVLQLPYAFSVREAEYFALGGVHILNRLGCVTHLSFGCETDDLTLLSHAAALMAHPDEALEKDMRLFLDKGLSFAAAQGRGVAARLGIPPALLDAPNTALALSYLRALLRTQSELIPVPVLRQHDYHAPALEAFPSATAVRGAILRGDWQGVASAVPGAALPILIRAVRAGICPPHSMDAPLRSWLLTAAPAALSALPGISEGLDQRILKAAKTTVTREEWIAAVKTRRYTYGRISRCLCHGWMGVTAADLPPLPQAARILGFRASAQGLMKKLQKSGFPLYSRPTREPSAALDVRADDMWRILAGQPRGETYRQPPVIVP